MFQLNSKEKSGISNSSENLHIAFQEKKKKNKEQKKKTKEKIKIYYHLLKSF